MILVVGATGVVGGMIARRLLDEEKEVRVLVRRDSPSSQLVERGLATSAEELIEAGAQPVHGDLRDRASLDVAVEGVESVITTANSAMRGGADNPQSVDLEGNRNLIEAAARDASVEHFIFVSLLGADVNNPSPFVQAKARSEQTLQESGVEYTILAPTAFMEMWPAMVVGMPALQGRPITLVGEARRRHSFVSNRDLAVGGPEPLSWREVVATYERVLGRSIPVEFVGMGEPVPGLPDPMPTLLSGMETYDSDVEMEEISRTFDVPLMRLETFVREQVASQSA
jgi:uncharacterized protein YbjT (DUF2867 family)